MGEPTATMPARAGTTYPSGDIRDVVGALQTPAAYPMHSYRNITPSDKDRLSIPRGGHLQEKGTVDILDGVSSVWIKLGFSGGDTNYLSEPKLGNEDPLRAVDRLLYRSEYFISNIETRLDTEIKEGEKMVARGKFHEFFEEV